MRAVSSVSEVMGRMMQCALLLLLFASFAAESAATSAGCQRTVSCGFEQSMCGFTTPSNGNNWFRVHHHYGIPDGRGYYIYSSKRYNYSSAKLNLTSPPLCQAATVNVAFIFVLTKPQSDLQVITQCQGQQREQRDVSYSFNYRAIWRQANFSLLACSDSDTTVIFRGTMAPFSGMGSIALDDINIRLPLEATTRPLSTESTPSFYHILARQPTATSTIKEPLPTTTNEPTRTTTEEEEMVTTTAKPTATSTIKEPLPTTTNEPTRTTTEEEEMVTTTAKPTATTERKAAAKTTGPMEPPTSPPVTTEEPMASSTTPTDSIPPEAMTTTVTTTTTTTSTDTQTTESGTTRRTTTTTTTTITRTITTTIQHCQATCLQDTLKSFHQ